ncbi:MAG: HXXEE domain-containing protein [Lewinellaceae bacterium]|nr:HXXEE domain-containing protein [Saprospiraceae bacterium]MCB9329600.1 HXXEE domain-containing protein [Lewinellaceae bacterium]
MSFFRRTVKFDLLAWSLPLLYLVHLLEEYYAGERFPVWFSRVLHAALSEADFILINTIGIAVFFGAVLVYSISRKNKIIVVGLGCVLFINGFVHLFSSIISGSYSPGTISGLFLYIPMGFLLLFRTMPPLTSKQRLTGLLLGGFIHIIVAAVALNI